MRKLKFRAFEKDVEGRESEMSYDQDFCLAMIGHNDGFEIMQFTGLKDKKGIDIYEGDIVYFDDWGYFKEISFPDSYETIYGWSPSRIKPVMEIIGNIYQNPEMIPNDD